jgi:Spy/CpxP family protein refolding chaperone
MMRKLKRGLATAVAAAMVLSSYVPVSFAAEEETTTPVTKTSIVWSDDHSTCTVYTSVDGGGSNQTRCSSIG